MEDSKIPLVGEGYAAPDTVANQEREIEALNDTELEVYATGLRKAARTVKDNKAFLRIARTLLQGAIRIIGP